MAFPDVVKAQVKGNPEVEGVSDKDHHGYQTFQDFGDAVNKSFHEMLTI